MSEFWLALWAAILGGLVTSFVVLAIARYWESVFLPWFENRVYQGVRIEGRWKSQWQFRGETRTEYPILRQRAHKISGEISYPKDSEGRSHRYELTGTLFETSFTALTHEVGTARVERGAIVLFVRPGGSIPEMRGLAIWFDDDKNLPVAVEDVWTKEE